MVAKIKIISNPYQKKIAYQSWNEANQEWKDINRQTNGNSKLLNEKLVCGFFPFKVKNIVDVIIEEYHKAEIVFEGNEDEYKELQEVCKNDNYSDLISLEKSNLSLENARDIFPEINEVFNENLRPLIIQTGNVYEKIKTELEKYTDVSNDIIPICVLGNYSSGKSTFINALIGSEILPSGAEPVTAKIYKIKQSAYPNSAAVSFKYNNQHMKLKFEDDTFKFSMTSAENELSQKLEQELNSLGKSSITFRVNRVIEVLNNYEAANDNGRISDTIEIEVPFNQGLWGETLRQFVIFDTPGSNSASNRSHAEILKEALGGFSNGLPLYLSEFDKLDSTDNESLYKDIEKLEELDDRFTMVIVNKADAAELDKGGFSKEKEQRILGETIPKNLYKSGIFFVSSVVGLGAKNNGDFIDDHYAELFDEKHTKFSDESSRFYKTLYNYNIMPEQLKAKSVEKALENPNKLWANSGLLTVEKEIQTFAVKYSAYNKCQQAKLFLDKIIQATSDEIETIKTEREEIRNNLHEKLQKDEKELVDKIETSSSESQIQYEETYQEFMCSLDEKASSQMAIESLKQQEAEITKSHQNNNSFDDKKNEASESVNSLVDNFGKSVKGVFQKHNLDSLKQLGKDIVDDLGKVVDTYESLNETKKKINQETAQELQNDVTKEFTKRFDEAQELMDRNSKEYWANKTQNFKENLIEIVTGSKVLDAEKRAELEQIIMAYGAILFESHAEEIFLKDNFKKRIGIGDFVLFESDNLNIEKLAKKYNSEMATKVVEMRQAIQASHTDSFTKWKESLVNTVTSKIVEYSPMLHSQAQIIKEESEKILALEDKQHQLAFYAQTISKMMEWK